MPSKYMISGRADIGVGCEKQEDFILYKELDPNNLFVLVVDGSTSIEGHIKPGIQVATEIQDTVERMYNSLKRPGKVSGFLNNPLFYMKEAFLYANRLLGAFKMGNEELYAGYAASVTGCLFRQDGRFFCVHTGNTRMYIIRDGQIVQVTKDQTKGQQLMDEGKIDIDTYYNTPYSLQITGGLGYVIDPEIQCIKHDFEENDIAMLSTDGIHYAIQDPYIPQIILQSQDLTQACDALVLAAKEEVKYPDNMSVVLVCYNYGEEE